MLLFLGIVPRVGYVPRRHNSTGMVINSIRPTIRLSRIAGAMVKVLRMISALLIGWSAIAGIAQQSVESTEGLSTASTEALHGGTLRFWVSSRLPAAPIWNGFTAELKNDYPGLQLQWKVIQRDTFLSALGDALRNGQAPDVVFSDNYAQEGSLVQRHAGRIMAGLPRHGERGWWMILNSAHDPKVAEAFFIWLEQPKGWQPVQPATHLLTAADEAEIRAISKETVEGFGTLPVKLPQDELDPAMAVFDWKPVRQRHTPEDERQNYSIAAEQVGGNTRLAFVALSTQKQSEGSFGVVHSFFMLRKDGSTWKVLFLEPSLSLSGIDQLLARLDGVGLSNDSQRGSTNIRLLAPGDGDHVTRFPATEIEFEVKGDIGELTGVESQYSNPEQMEWSPTTIRWVGRPADRDGISRMPAPFGVGKQPHRWRV
jgi:hypothetical protein